MRLVVVALVTSCVYCASNSVSRIDEDKLFASLELYPFGHEYAKGGIDYAFNVTLGGVIGVIPFKFSAEEDSIFAKLIHAQGQLRALVASKQQNPDSRLHRQMPTIKLAPFSTKELRDFANDLYLRSRGDLVEKIGEANVSRLFERRKVSVPSFGAS